MKNQQWILAGAIGLLFAFTPTRGVAAEEGEDGDAGERRERAEHHGEGRGRRGRRGDDEAEAEERAHEARMRKREAEMRKKLDKNISLNLVKADLDFVATKICQVSGINIVIAKDILDEKEEPVTVSVHLEDVTVEQAIRAIARQNNLKVDFEPGLIFIDWKPDPKEVEWLQLGEVTIRSGQITLKLDIHVGDLEEEHRMDMIRTAARRAMRQGGGGDRIELRLGDGGGLFGQGFQERIRRAIEQGENPEKLRERIREMHLRRRKGRRGGRDGQRDEEQKDGKPAKDGEEHAF